MTPVCHPTWYARARWISFLSPTPIAISAFHSSTKPPRAQVDTFDIINGVWTTTSIVKLSEARWDLACSAGADLLLFAGGLTAPNLYSRTVDYYNFTQVRSSN
jgi:hypothetical protein